MLTPLKAKAGGGGQGRSKSPGREHPQQTSLLLGSVSQPQQCTVWPFRLTVRGPRGPRRAPAGTCTFCVLTQLHGSRTVPGGEQYPVMGTGAQGGLVPGPPGALLTQDVHRGGSRHASCPSMPTGMGAVVQEALWTTAVWALGPSTDSALCTPHPLPLPTSSAPES